MLDILKVIGAFLGTLSFCWQVWNLFASYLYIDLSVDPDDCGIIFAKAIVENKSQKDKKIDNALLLVGPEEELPTDTFNSLAKFAKLAFSVKSTDEIAKIRLNDSIYDEVGRAVIPLPFFYSENIAIGDERVSYRAPINSSKINRGKPYSVRFFLWVAGRYHRSTHDSFLIKETM